MYFQKTMVAVALATCAVSSVYAQSSSGGDGGGQGGGNTATTTTFQQWLNTRAGTNKGRVSRQIYMEEAGRRWDTMDKDKSGLTTDQIHGMYGSGPAAQMGGPTSTQMQDKKGVKQ